MNARILTMFLSFCFISGSLHAQGTAFSYQGRLDQNGVPATGHFNFQFQLYTNATIGNQFGGPIARNGVLVTNGLFTVSLDFGSTAFFGWPLWLQMWVAPSNQPQPALTLLSPRQPVTPAPYALFASTASNTAVNAVGTTSLQNNAVTSAKLASGTAVRSLNGLTDAINLTAGLNIAITPVGSSLQISTVGSATGWGLTGNAGLTPNNFIGSSDGRQVRLHATNGFVIDDSTASLSFGETTRQMLNLWRTNYGIGVQDDTLYQRTADRFAWHRNGVHTNRVADPGQGGSLLMVLDSAGRLGLGTATPQASLHVGNGRVQVDGTGGELAFLEGNAGEVRLGSLNSQVTNVALWNAGRSQLMSLRAHEIRANMYHGNFLGIVDGSLYGFVNGALTGVVAATSLKLGNSSVPGSVVTASDANGNVAFERGLRVIPSGQLGLVNIIGGSQNTVATGVAGATISGGGSELAGLGNHVGASYGTVAGGSHNSANGLFSTVLGGNNNTAGGAYSVAGGQQAKALHDGSFVWADSQPAVFASTVSDQFSIRAAGGLRLHTNTSVDFGMQTRQMLNLWSTNFGVGVQANTLYSRTANDFAWYKNGGHADAYGNAGTGGTEQMRLNATGRLSLSGDYVQVKGAGNEQAFLGGDGNGDVEIGSDNNGVSTVVLWNRSRSDHMDLYSRDASVRVLTIRGGADLAEPFQMSEGDLPKGSLVIIDDENPGRLKLSKAAYDTRVAGILSGANGVNAGITLQQEGLLEGGQNVALSGRVYALADASTGPIKPGDLLTSSSTPGHVMRVGDPALAAGAVVGKAMGSLKEGTGLVLVLVSLQ